LLSPFDIYFSQSRIRTEFQDSNTTEATIPQIRVEPLGFRSSPSAEVAEAAEVPAGEASTDGSPPAEPVEPAEGEDEYGLGEGADDYSEETRGKEFKMLWHPFPRIEVTKWRCKLREPDGSPKLDPDSGLELYSHEERWFSFDNRRLFCLQKAAAAAYSAGGSTPQEVRCEVVEIPFAQARMRELRKFDTKTFGCSVLAGRREDPNLVFWSWRSAVGLPEEEQPEQGIARQKSTRWRGARKGPNSGSSQSGNNKRRGDQEEEGQGHGLELMRSALLFFLVYLGLRVVVSIFRHRWNATSGLPPGAGIPDLVSTAAGLDGVLPPS